MRKIKILVLTLFLLGISEGLFGKSVDILFKFPTSFYLSTGDKQHSAPSPVYFNPGVGLIWPNKGLFSVEPLLSFNYSYYLFYDGKAMPSEIENRTATTLAFLLEVPATFSINIKSTQLKFHVGPSMLMRFGWLSNGATEAEDIPKINNYFWSNARFLYFSGGLSWMVNLEKSKFGPYFNIHFPIGSIFAQEGLNGMILSGGLKVSL